MLPNGFHFVFDCRCRTQWRRWWVFPAPVNLRWLEAANIENGV